MGMLDVKPNENEVIFKNIVKGLAFLAYVAAVVFGDIMYIMSMRNAFPHDGLLVLAYAGAVTTAVSAVLLILGKFLWFGKGPQVFAVYGFWVIEIAALALNTILATRVALGIPVTGALGWWNDVSPATPLLSAIGWGIVFAMDPSTMVRNERQATINRMQSYLARHLGDAIQSDDVKALLKDGATQAARGFVGEVVGPNYTPLAGAQKPVDMDELVSKVTHAVNASLQRESGNATPVATMPSRMEAEDVADKPMQTVPENLHLGANGNGNGNGHSKKG